MHGDKKVLVVDDDADIREIISTILDMEGFKVAELDNGMGVLSEVKRNRPDVILLDVMLGDADGRDICKLLKESSFTRTIPIIIISATHGRHTMTEKNCGADDYITKPFGVDHLLDLVKYYAVL